MMSFGIRSIVGTTKVWAWPMKKVFIRILKFSHFTLTTCSVQKYPEVSYYHDNVIMKNFHDNDNEATKAICPAVEAKAT